MFKTIPVWELDQYINGGGNIMVIDLRDRTSYKRGHIQGAVNLPYEDRENWMYTLPEDKYLLFYCARGGQSMQICRNLEQYGYRVINIANGIAYYKGKYMVY